MTWKKTTNPSNTWSWRRKRKGEEFIHALELNDLSNSLVAMNGILKYEKVTNASVTQKRKTIAQESSNKNDLHFAVTFKQTAGLSWMASKVQVKKLESSSWRGCVYETKRMSLEEINDHFLHSFNKHQFIVSSSMRGSSFCWITDKKTMQK